MTTDAYGRYLGRHVRSKDLPAGFRPGDARHDEMAALYPGDGAGECERYERPVFDVPLPRAPRVALGTVTR